MKRIRWIALMAVLAVRDAQADPFDDYVRPYAESNNFSGAILVVRDGKVLFRRAYGRADRESGAPNKPDTRFHIASLSMQFTSAAVMRLAERGALTLDDFVSALVSDVPNGGKIRVRDLLTETSGLPDVNDLPNYDKLLTQHQTTQTLLAAISGLPPAAEPGGPFRREEHSAFNLLARIVEIKTGKPFAAAMQSTLFEPVQMHDSGIDDDNVSGDSFARGYEPVGVSDLKPADAIHWSAKTGNASAYTTVDDQMRWMDAFFADRYLSANSRAAMLDMKTRVGYGWFKNISKRFGEPIYYMNGRSPGFASFAAHLPQEKLTVIVLANVYSSVTTTLGLDLAAIALGRPHETFAVAAEALDLAVFPLRFRFGEDFFQKNAVLVARAVGTGLFLDWPTGSSSPLIPVGPDRFIDRSYWEEVRLQRGSDGHIAALRYDTYTGTVLPVDAR